MFLCFSHDFSCPWRRCYLSPSLLLSAHSVFCTINNIHKKHPVILSFGVFVAIEHFLFYQWDLIFFQFFKTFYLFLRDSVREGGAQRVGDTESEAGSGLSAVSTEPDMGLELTNCKIMTPAEVGGLTD